MFTTSAVSLSSATLSDKLFGEEATTSPVSVFELFSSFGAVSLMSSLGAAGLSTGVVFAITFFSPVAVFPTGLFGGVVAVPVDVEADGPVETASDPLAGGLV